MKEKEIRELLVTINQDSSAAWLTKCLDKIKKKDLKTLFEDLSKFLLVNHSYCQISSRVFKRIKKPVYVVYLLYCKGSVVYVGKSKDVVTRLHTHLKDKTFDTVNIVQCTTEKMQKQYENALIDRLRPPLNKHLMLDKPSKLHLSDIETQTFVDWLNKQNYFTIPKLELIKNLNMTTEYIGYTRCMSFSYGCAINDDETLDKRPFSYVQEGDHKVIVNTKYHVYTMISEACNLHNLWGHFEKVTHSIYRLGDYYITDKGRWRNKGSNKWYTSVKLDVIIGEIIALNNDIIAVVDSDLPVLPIWIGKYKGMLMEDVRIEDPKYYEWVCSNFKKVDLLKLGINL